jgi:uncharacterized protein (DUF1778 family)
MDEKKKPGRPRTRPDELVGLRLDVTPDEADRVRKAAGAVEESASAFARKAVVDRADRVLKRKRRP